MPSNHRGTEFSEVEGQNQNQDQKITYHRGTEFSEVEVKVKTKKYSTTEARRRGEGKAWLVYTRANV